MTRRLIVLRSLSVQLVLSFIALVLLTAVAAGVPALWLLHAHVRTQAQNQVEQGRLAAQALYEARKSELASLATLTAQRPTLRQLLAQEDQPGMAEYLTTLQQGSGLDFVLVCSMDQQLVAHAGASLPAAPCLSQAGSEYFIIPDGTRSQIWLMATHTLADDADREMGRIYVGLHLDDGFAMQMRDQTGLEHTLLVDGVPAATSMQARLDQPSPAPQEDSLQQVKLQDRDFYIGSFPLTKTGLRAEVALEVTEFARTARNLAWTLSASILSVVVIASLVGILLARRIGSPLAQLATAASAMSEGDLDTPFTPEAHVREVALVAQALEGARVDLKHSLTELRREKDWTDNLLEAIVEGIVTLDRQGRITFFSPGAERITGWKREEVLGRTCDGIFQPTDTSESFSELIPAPGRRQKIRMELRDGRQAVLAVSGARLLPPTRGEDRVALVFRDVSEEEAIHRLLGDFLANVAHEFRTPLSALAASVELLIDQAPELSPAELEELLLSLHLGTLGLQTLVDNLLESASIETGHFRVHPRPSNLADIIGDAIDMMQPLLDKHAQRLVLELPMEIPTVLADPRRTVQVLINLLSNASKYGPDDAEIEVSATVQGPWVKVTVSDSGPGIDPTQRKNLFQRFVYSRTGNDKAQVGAGLGLSVVKAVVEAHGAEVGIDERPGGGSAFWFTLPLEDGNQSTGK
jgi:PAS domain S-box-containing protein